MAFLCIWMDIGSKNRLRTVKQQKIGGTCPHKAQGITDLFGEKHPFPIRVYVGGMRIELLKTFQLLKLVNKEKVVRFLMVKLLLNSFPDTE